MDDFVIGAEVRVDGLASASASRHNGKSGKILDVFPDENKVRVILDDSDSSDIKVATGKLTLIRPAGRPLRKIPVVLLGEMHDDLRCGLKNSSILMAMGVKTLSRKNEFLLVSEGMRVNPCYEALELPRDRVLLEYDTLSKAGMLDKLILTTNTLFDLLEGTVTQGTGAAAGPGTPDTVTIEPKWFMQRAKSYWPLLQVVPNGTTMYEQMVAAAFSRNTQLFYSSYGGILDYLSQSDYLNDISASAEIKRSLQLFVATRDESRHLRQVSTLFMLSRDAAVIRKVEERARSENSTLRTIVIIFGAAHFDNLRTLIQRSDVLEFDSARSSNIKIGGKKMKKVKKRISKSHLTKKCNSKSKKCNSKSKKCKTHCK